MREICYRPLRASSHISTYTLQPEGIIQADVLQRAYSAYGLLVPGVGEGPAVPASRVAQAQAWARTISALGLNYPREVCLGYVWTVLLSNAFSLICGYELRDVARTTWRRNVVQTTYVGPLEGSLSDIEAHAAGLATGNVVYLEAPGAVLERIGPVLAVLASNGAIEINFRSTQAISNIANILPETLPGRAKFLTGTAAAGQAILVPNPSHFEMLATQFTCSVPLDIRLVSNDGVAPRNAVGVAIRSGTPFDSTYSTAYGMPNVGGAPSPLQWQVGSAFSPPTVFEALLCLGVALPDASGKSAFFKVCERAVCPEFKGAAPPIMPTEMDTAYPCPTCTLAQGVKLIPQGDTVISSLQQSWAVSKERDSALLALQRIQEAWQLGGLHLFDVTGQIGKMMAASTAQGLRYLGLPAGAIVLDGPFTLTAPGFRPSLQGVINGDGCMISDYAEVVGRACIRLFDLKLSAVVLVTLNAQSTVQCPLVRPTHTGLAVYQQKDVLLALEPVNPATMPLAWLRPVAEPGWSSLPTVAARVFLAALNQRGGDSLLLEPTRRSVKTEDGVQLVQTASTGNGPGTMCAFDAVANPGLRAIYTIEAAMIEVREGSSTASFSLARSSRPVPLEIQFWYSDVNNGFLPVNSLKFRNANLKQASYLTATIARTYQRCGCLQLNRAGSLCHAPLH